MIKRSLAASLALLYVIAFFVFGSAHAHASDEEAGHSSHEDCAACLWHSHMAVDEPVSPSWRHGATFVGVGLAKSPEFLFANSPSVLTDRGPPVA